MDSEIRQIIDLLFSRRLDTFRRTISPEATETTTLNKTARLSTCADRFQAHCSRTLRDYITLLELFDCLRISDGIGPTFDEHIDEAADDLLTALDATSHAERNRIANQAASIKASAAAEIGEEIARAQKAASQGAGEPEELDDRLPLGRRGAFDRDLARAVQEAERDNAPFALVMVDIDHFKRVNDDHGHPVGDEVLVEVAKLVVNRTAGKGTAYRFGGEEFSLLLPSYSAEEAVGLAERIRKDLEAATVSSKKLSVTASFGVASLPAHATKSEVLLEKADASLYQAKRGGRNRVATSD